MIRPMTVTELELVLDWAAGEGWNPGLDDAAAFYATDPAGFLIKEVDGQPVPAISVVNHDPDYAFLGLYICKPAFRGQGHGINVWRAGLSSAPFGVARGPTVVDTTGPNTALAQLLKDQNFAPRFETARMFKGTAPVSNATKFQAIATMELG